MSTLGKILVFFNVVVAIALMFLAGMDYAERRSGAYAALLHELWLTGLPVDSDEIVTQEPNEPLASRLATGVLAKHFEKAKGGTTEFAGPEVKTVMEELDRVQAKVRQNVDSLPNDEQKRAKLKSYLLSQAKNIGERDELKNKIEKGPVAEAQAELDQRFVLVKLLHGAKGTENWEGVRFAAAPLLVNLSFEPDWLERVRAVLGLEAYTHGVETSARMMEQIAADVKEGAIRDQGTFVSSYLEMVEQLKYQAENLYQANKRVAELKAITAERQVEVNQRQTEATRNQQDLAKLTAESNVEVGKLEAIQRDLFAVQQRLGKAMEATRTLDEQLRKRAAEKK